MRWSQHWLDLLFLHWRVPTADVQPRLPPGLTADTFAGSAWVSVVIFRLRVRPRWGPFVPGLSAVAEANLRTYVRCDGRPGVYFLAIHADNRWAACLARLLSPMPYTRADLTYRRAADEFTFAGAGFSPADGPLSVRFRPVGEPRPAADDPAGAWLLERYRGFARDRRGVVWEADVSHPPWAVRGVELLAGAGFPGPPDALHYSDGVRARFGSFRRALPNQVAVLPRPI